MPRPQHARPGSRRAREARVEPAANGWEEQSMAKAVDGRDPGAVELAGQIYTPRSISLARILLRSSPAAFSVKVIDKDRLDVDALVARPRAGSARRDYSSFRCRRPRRRKRCPPRRPPPVFRVALERSCPSYPAHRPELAPGRTGLRPLDRAARPPVRYAFDSIPTGQLARLLRTPCPRTRPRGDSRSSRSPGDRPHVPSARKSPRAFRSPESGR